MNPAPLTDEMAGNRLRWLLKAGWQLPAGACVLLLLYGFRFPMPQAISVVVAAVLVGIAAFVAGALLGFLFGIPRSAQAADPLGGERPLRGGYTVNTNLEQISDWLTKILVGVGLIQLGNIGAGLGQLLTALTPAFGSEAGSSAVAGAVLAFFSVWGFLLSYLLTRTFLTAAFRAFDVAEVTAIAVEEAVTVVTAKTEEKEEAGALALTLTHRQLSSSSSEEPVRFEELVGALREASASIREQVLLQAQVQRRTSWRWPDEGREDVRTDMVARHSRTLPVLKALAAVQTEDARVLAELGYALKDDSEPDFRLAREALTSALLLARRAGTPLDWILLNRGIAGIRLDREQAGLNGAYPVSAEEVYSDLSEAAAGRPRVRSIVQTDPEIVDWLNRVGRPVPALAAS